MFDFGPNVAPRLGVSYDLFGNGRTALKAYYGRFYNQFGSQISEAANPNAIVNQAVSWTDANGNLALDPGELGHLHRLPARPVPDRRRRCDAVPTARSSTSASSSSWPATWRCRRQLPPPRAPQRARHPRPRPRPRRLHADRPHLRRSDQRADAVDHHLQPAAGVHQRPRSLHQQRRVPAERLRRRPVRLPEADVEPLADAGRPEPAAAPRLRPQRHLHRRRLQQPELVDQPRRRLGVHRPAVDGDGVGQLPAPLGHHGLGQVHRAGRRSAQPHRRPSPG